MNSQEQAFVDKIMDSNSRLRCENHRLIVFIRSLTDPEMYGHAVSAEVRRAASVFIKPMEEMDEKPRTVDAARTGS